MFARLARVFQSVAVVDIQLIQKILTARLDIVQKYHFHASSRIFCFGSCVVANSETTNTSGNEQTFNFFHVHLFSQRCFWLRYKQKSPISTWLVVSLVSALSWAMTNKFWQRNILLTSVELICENKISSFSAILILNWCGMWQVCSLRQYQVNI